MIRRLAYRLGIDRAIFYTSSARIFQGFGGVVSVLLVSGFLTGVEQGFYYTFASLLAIQVFFELGLGSIITQFVAHEKAHLEESADGVLSGLLYHRSRLAYLLRFCIKWYGWLAVGLWFVLSVVGYLFFSYFYRADVVVSWRLPWLLLSFGTALNFMLAPVSAYLEGLGRVRQIAKIRLVQQVVSQVSVWLGLVAGGHLYVTVFPPFLMVLVFVVMGCRDFVPLLRSVLTVRVVDRVHYRKEVFPYQWRIALSWVSGYFIFQLFNPVLFATEGAVVAGQMGMTLAALNAILGLTLAWMTTKVPYFSQLIALKQFEELDGVFRRTFWQSFVLTAVALCVFFIALVCIRQFDIVLFGVDLGRKFLSSVPLALMMSTILCNQMVNSWATYLRCHKREPMLWQSLVMGVLCSCSTLFLGKYYGVLGMTLGYAVLSVVGCVWAYFIFVFYRNQWHHG